uniref:Uncharacterized protein n=1 Tax=Populus trichocarpa TaxID=3694 RepID=A0A2K1Z0L9_POPTR
MPNSSILLATTPVIMVSSLLKTHNRPTGAFSLLTHSPTQPPPMIGFGPSPSREDPVTHKPSLPSLSSSHPVFFSPMTDRHFNLYNP